MGNEILKKLDMFSDDISESRVIGDEPVGTRPIQFMRFWNGFRPGDRVDVFFGEDFISFAGTNAEGQFAGVKKEYALEDPMEMKDFKSAEGNFWNFV